MFIKPHFICLSVYVLESVCELKRDSVVLIFQDMSAGECTFALKHENGEADKAVSFYFICMCPLTLFAVNLWQYFQMFVVV